ncbi:MAG: hypothetical protein S4CHLAM37_06090 [Chlamydiia bacterium]|nr:hypothetical protein [Chlamydiia bacterium]
MLCEVLAKKFTLMLPSNFVRTLQEMGMRKFVLLGILAVFFCGCSSNHSDKQTVRFHDDGRAKAVTTITAVYDPQDIHLPWSLATDLTEMIQGKLSKRANIFLINKISSHAPELDEEANLDVMETSSALDENKTLNIHEENLKVKYPGSEFVVFLELANHDIHPKQDTDKFFDKITPSYVLDVAMRVRIYDLRHEKPAIVLQEIVQEKHLLPKQFAKLDYDSAIWGKKTYSISPLGFAHTQFAKDVAKRIESYLVLAKTK